MNPEEIIKIPDEKSPLVSSNNEKNPIRFLHYKILVFWFNFHCIRSYLAESPALFGQEIPLSILTDYLMPFTKCHAVSIFFMGVIPFIFLFSMSVSTDIFPTTESNKFMLPFYAALKTIIIPTVFESVAEPLFYLYHRFCETNYVAGMTENVLVISYGIAYAFSYEIWLFFLVPTYNHHCDIFTMCKFALQQLNRPRGVEV